MLSGLRSPGAAVLLRISRLWPTTSHGTTKYRKDDVQGDWASIFTENVGDKLEGVHLHSASAVSRRSPSAGTYAFSRPESRPRGKELFIENYHERRGSLLSLWVRELSLKGTVWCRVYAGLIFSKTPRSKRLLWIRTGNRGCNRMEQLRIFHNSQLKFWRLHFLVDKFLVLVICSGRQDRPI